jgi:two-component system response regulator FixJ
MEQFTVFVVDDDPMIVRLVKATLVTQGDWNLRSYEHAEALLDDVGPDDRGCILLDLDLPGMSGEQLQQELLAKRVEMPVLVLSGTEDAQLAVRVLKQGARDLISKPFVPSRLRQMVQEAILTDTADSQTRSRRQQAKERLEELTEREQEILRLLVEGHGSKSIAQQLSISTRTVESHRFRLMHKLKTDSLASAVRLWLSAAV